ncbi:MAG: Phosphoglucomutase [Chlamydiae bacterium]|nr:Phosphoglucomutase [Chlamydiota bacterium]
MMAISLDATTKKNVEKWLQGNFDEQTKAHVQDLMDHEPQELVNAFYTNLRFGTGGMRGLMGPGTNRMNIYTVRGAAQGLANYLLKQQFSESPISVLIGYDSRLNSRLFAEEAARVLAGNGIRAYINQDLRPVPMVSFGTRFKHCQAGIMITASHNPAVYNGFKVYWGHGAQVLPPNDKGIVEEVHKIENLDEIKVSHIDNPNIVWYGPDLDEAYLQTISELQHCQRDNQEYGDTLKVIYTSLHGTGITVTPQALAMWGFINIHIVESQKEPDGNFPTVPAPNPEIREALKIGIDCLVENEGDILLATDADTDRVGCVVNHNNQINILDGNEIACICLHHILQNLSNQKLLPERPALVKTIVTTELFQAIADFYSIPCFNVLTGFKYIGQLINSWENDPNGFQYIFGGEESYGYLLSDYARDKDAVISCCLLAEAALQAKKQNKTLVDQLHDIYEKFGVYRSKLGSLNFGETKEGREQMKNAMVRLREIPPEQILGSKILAIDDYLSSTKTILQTGKRESLELPKSDVLVYWLEDESKIAIRPSGTEPKVKVYSEVKSQRTSPVDLGIEHCDVIAEEYVRMVKSLMKG